MYCKKCGCNLEDNYKFCIKCGCRLEGEKDRKKLVRILSLLVIIPLIITGVLILVYYRKISNEKSTIVDIEESIDKINTAELTIKEDFIKEDGKSSVELMHEHEYEYQAKGEGVHAKKCNVENCTDVIEESCEYDEDGTCVCGNVTITNPKDFNDIFQGAWGACVNGNFTVLLVRDSRIDWFDGGDYTYYTSEIQQAEQISNNSYMVSGVEYDANIEFDIDEVEIERTEKDRKYTFYEDEYDKWVIIEGINEKYPLVYCGTQYDLYEDMDGERRIQKFVMKYIAKFEERKRDGSIVGKWTNEGAAWSEDYLFEFFDDGTVKMSGYRNEEIGRYEAIDEKQYKLEFDINEYDMPGEGWVPDSPGRGITCDLLINGDVAGIKVDDPNYLTNLYDGQLIRVIE